MPILSPKIVVKKTRNFGGDLILCSGNYAKKNILIEHFVYTVGTFLILGMINITLAKQYNMML